MVQAYGHLGHFGYNEQGSLGIIKTDSLEFAPIISENLAETIEQLVEENIRGRHAAGPTHEGPRASAGGITFEPTPNPLGSFLRAICGQSVSTFVDSATNHVFTPLVNSDFSDLAAFPPQTLVLNRNVDLSEAYGDMVANELTLDFAHSQLLSVTVGFMGGQRSNVAQATPVFPGGLPWKWDQGSLSWDGAAVSELRSMTITQTNNVEPVYTIANSTTPQRIKRTDFPSIEGTATLLLTEAVHSHFQSLFQNQEESQILLNINGITSPGTLKIDVPKARITAYAPNISGVGQIEVDVAFTAKFDETSSYLGEYTLVNCRVSYP